MSIFSSPAEHTGHPPSTWTVRKCGRKWGLFIGNEHPSDTFATKREAEAAKTTGFLANLYSKESRWYAGEAVENWKPYKAKPDHATADYFQPVAEQASLFAAGMATDGGWVQPMPEPAAAPLYVPNRQERFSHGMDDVTLDGKRARVVSGSQTCCVEPVDLEQEAIYVTGEVAVRVLRDLGGAFLSIRDEAP